MRYVRVAISALTFVLAVLLVSSPMTAKAHEFCGGPFVYHYGFPFAQIGQKVNFMSKQWIIIAESTVANRHRWVLQECERPQPVPAPRSSVEQPRREETPSPRSARPVVTPVPRLGDVPASGTSPVPRQTGTGMPR